jgi:radical SAM superfamily enzyme YgiQ (UPF0313 family)
MDILLVNPHLEFPSDTSGRSGLLRSKEHLLNAGLLSISTYLNDEGIDAYIADLTTFEYPLKELERILVQHNPRYVGISNQSCHSYLSIKEYAKLIKDISRKTKVVVGGLHASGIPTELLDESDDVDYVVVGEGELALADLIQGTESSGAVKKKVSDNGFIISGQRYPEINGLPRLDYTQYPDYHEFVPYVEESRGCASRCDYCTSPSIHKGIRIKDPSIISEDIRLLQELYGDERFHFFIEANNFGVNHRKTEELAELLAGANHSWRTESRVDTFPTHLLDKLVDGGLRVLDIGLESGSPEMLRRMNKTKDPSRYLGAGLGLAEEVARNGKCLLKFNMMLYYGETLSTIKETREYLRRISGITPLAIGIGPVRMDPGSKNHMQFVNGGNSSFFDNSFWGKTHCYPAQEFQTSRTYYESKRHSQLPYSMTYEQFMQQTVSIPPNERQWTE